MAHAHFAILHVERDATNLIARMDGGDCLSCELTCDAERVFIDGDFCQSTICHIRCIFACTTTEQHDSCSLWRNAQRVGISGSYADRRNGDTRVITSHKQQEAAEDGAPKQGEFRQQVPRGKRKISHFLNEKSDWMKE